MVQQGNRGFLGSTHPHIDHGDVSRCTHSLIQDYFILFSSSFWTFHSFWSILAERMLTLLNPLHADTVFGMVFVLVGIGSVGVAFNVILLKGKMYNLCPIVVIVAFNSGIETIRQSLLHFTCIIIYCMFPIVIASVGEVINRRVLNLKAIQWILCILSYFWTLRGRHFIQAPKNKGN